MKKITRYARTLGNVATLGGSMTAEKIIKSDYLRQENARRLKMAIGKMKGPMMKIAQLLATIPEALPDDYARELAQLQNNAPPMGRLFVNRRMKAELGPGWQSRFQSFSEEPAAAASLGQVHKAMSLDGQELACKLQYPDMDSAIDADLKQLKLFFGLFEMFDSSLKTKKVQAELKQRLQEELDYELEARNIRLYQKMLADQAEIVVPNYYPDLSTKRLLTMNWLEGSPFMDLKTAPQAERNDMALKLFRAWYIPFYNFGIIHGDPHPGNYTVAPDKKLNLLDLGCIRVFPPSFVRGVIDLYRALETDDRDLAVSAYEVWGFRNLKTETLDILNVWAKFLYGPLLDNRVRVIGEAKGEVYGRETALKVHKELKRLGGVEVPQEFVFMDRAALGLGSVFIHLQAKVNWHDLFHDLTQNFTEKTLAIKQDALLKSVQD